MFAGATWLASKIEHDAMFSADPPGGARPETFTALKNAKTTLITTPDYDVFGDGTVVIKPAPGHTPGHFIYLLKGKDYDVIFTGDAAKNRAEFLSGKADGTYDQTVSSKSIAAIWSLWKARPGNVVIPGHDIPMVLKEGRPEYLAKREAAMKAWFGDDLDTMTTIELAVR